MVLLKNKLSQSLLKRSTAWAYFCEKVRHTRAHARLKHPMNGLIYHERIAPARHTHTRTTDHRMADDTLLAVETTSAVLSIASPAVGCKQQKNTLCVVLGKVQLGADMLLALLCQSACRVQEPVYAGPWIPHGRCVINTRTQHLGGEDDGRWISSIK